MLLILVCALAAVRQREPETISQKYFSMEVEPDGLPSLAQLEEQAAERAPLEELAAADRQVVSEGGSAEATAADLQQIEEAEVQASMAQAEEKSLGSPVGDEDEEFFDMDANTERTPLTAVQLLDQQVLTPFNLAYNATHKDYPKALREQATAIDDLLGRLRSVEEFVTQGYESKMLQWGFEKKELKQLVLFYRRCTCDPGILSRALNTPDCTSLGGFHVTALIPMPGDGFVDRCKALVQKKLEALDAGIRSGDSELAIEKEGISKSVTAAQDLVRTIVTRPEISDIKGGILKIRTDVEGYIKAHQPFEGVTLTLDQFPDDSERGVFEADSFFKEEDGGWIGQFEKKMTQSAKDDAAAAAAIHAARFGVPRNLDVAPG